MSQQRRAKGKARDLLEHLSSREPSREDPSPNDFQAVAITAAGRDTSHSCVGYHRQDLEDQDFILAHLSWRMHNEVTLISFQGTHLSRRKRKDVTLISFREEGDPIDRVSNSNAVFDRSRVSKAHAGCYTLRSR